MANDFKIKNGLFVDGDAQVTGSIKLLDGDNSNYVALQSPTTVNTNITFTLPSSTGSNGQVLTTDGSGNLSFTTVSSSGGSTEDAIAYAIALG